jgi:flavin-dependent dehydrogenase
MPGRSFRVAVVGGGPAGAAMAILLAADGADVVVFDDQPRDLVVGESLVPAIVPSLRRLGVEDEIAAIAQHKPGVAFTWTGGLRVAFTFARYRNRMVPYAYNVPRPGFEDVMRRRAAAVGARVVARRVRLARGVDDEPELVLDVESRRIAGWGDGHPDLLVDATGRSRVGVRLLEIEPRLGPRDDVAHFAHYEGYAWDEPPGQVLIGRVAGGWSWRIPLRDRISIGMVVRRETAARLGDTPVERLEAAIAATPELAATVRGATRVSDVATYSNYQLVTTRGVGRGWVAIGDAFGFVDPMLSPGTSVALRSAEDLADVLSPAVRAAREGRPVPSLDAGLADYATRTTDLLDAWMELVEYLYDGRMFALIKAGTDMVAERGDRIAHVMRDQAEMNVALLASGTAITSRTRRAALRFMGRYGLRGVAPEPLAIE